MASVYLYTGPEFGERDEAVVEIKKSLIKKFGDIDEHSYYLLETPFNKVMTILQSGTLFSNGVFIVCKNAELLKKKDDLELLSDWIKSEPDENTVLILISDEISVDSKLEKLIPLTNKKKFWELFEERKMDWLQKFFYKNGYKIKTDACELILDMIENNTQSLKNECSRFFILFPKDHTVTCEDVEAVLTHEREENSFSLFRHISNASSSAQKRLEEGILILQKIRLSKENSSVMIIAALASCFRKLILWHEIAPNGTNPSFEVLRNSGFSSKIMQSQYKNAAKIWSTGQATAILSILASTDMEIRRGSVALEDILLQKMLYEIIMKKGGQIASFEENLYSF